ncbi:MAG: SGNH/GDSL hydrolase family protein [Acidimicrobiia bacterium]|nr:SGNH/GDSL hydrolase family protein [Acidimicrobiia bacterium]
MFGPLAAVAAGLAVLLTAGETAAAVVFIGILAASLAALFANRTVLRGLLIAMMVVFLGSTAFLGRGVAQLITALTTTDGPVDPADPAALATAAEKVDGAKTGPSFRLELTEDEMTAYVLDGLRAVEDNPLRLVAFDVVDGENGEPGRLDFAARFKGGGVEASGQIAIGLDRGALQVELADVSVGSFDMPGLARSSLEDLVERVADFNTTLEEFQVDVQSIELGSDRLVITGTQGSTDLLTSASLLDGLRAAAASAVGAAGAPPERFGRGEVAARSATPVYVALGDSLAANVGVDDPRDGYVSRFHRQLERRDGVEYGLENFGVSGETTGTLIRSGQLDEAVAFMEGRDVAYVTIDIGANNLLGHLGSEACSESLDAPACRDRLDATFQSYGPDLEYILDELRQAAPDATIVFLTAYNPFSLGLGTELEGATDETLASFNAIAVAVAGDGGVLVADGFEPMRGRTASTTHMLDQRPDIHPLPIGYDVLTGALVDALQ